MRKKNKILIILLYLSIIVISFFAYSSIFYPLLNSDDAVSILMLHDFHFPDDIFFWGQDRVGSIIPLLGQIPYKLLNIPLLWAESLTHYAILILGFFALSSFFTTNFSKIAFAILWFLPIDPFLGLVRYSFGLQYAFIGFGLYFIKIQDDNTKKMQIKSPLPWWILSFASFLIAVWITESAIVTIMIILSISLLWTWYKDKKIPKRSVLFSLTGIISGTLIIMGLKNLVTVSSHYEYNQQLLNSISEIIRAIQLLYAKLIAGFSLGNPNPFQLIYNYLCLLLIASIPLLILTKNSNRIKNWKWITIFTLDGVAFILVNLVSHWSLLNGVARRYFVGVYIVFWISFLLFTENISNKRIKQTIRVTLMATLLLGALSIPYGYQYLYPKRLTPKAKVVGEFRQLGRIGIIADYWNSYGTSFVDPDHIKATPHDQAEVRNYRLVDSVFAQPNLYLIKDMWLDTFPDTIVQFRNTLYKAGEEFNIGDCNICEYKLLERNR